MKKTAKNFKKGVKKIVGGVSQFTLEEVAELKAFDQKISQDYYLEIRKSKRHRLAYQKRYDRAHKEEKKIYQHEYYLKRKSRTTFGESNGTSENTLTA